MVQCELLILRQLNFHVCFEHPHKVCVRACVCCVQYVCVHVCVLLIWRPASLSVSVTVGRVVFVVTHQTSVCSRQQVKLLMCSPVGLVTQRVHVIG